MQNKIPEKTFEVTDTKITFDRVCEREYIPVEYKKDIQAANLLLIPDENRYGEGELLFPETTRDFFQFMKDASESDIVPEIAMSDDAFRRLELHSETIVLATMIVKDVVLPIVLGMISAYLYDWAKRHRRNADDLSAEVNVVVEKTETGTSKMLSYKGPASGVKETFDSVAPTLFDEDK